MGLATSGCGWRAGRACGPRTSCAGRGRGGGSCLGSTLLGGVIGMLGAIFQCISLSYPFWGGGASCGRRRGRRSLGRGGWRGRLDARVVRLRECGLRQQLRSGMRSRERDGERAGA